MVEEEGLLAALLNDLRHAAFALALAPPDFGRREIVLSVATIVLASMAVILVFATATISTNLFVPFIALGTIASIAVGKCARGLLTAIFTVVLTGATLAIVAARNGGLPWVIAQSNLVIVTTIWSVVAPVTTACIVTAILRRR